MADFAVQRKKISNGNGLKSKGEVFGSGPQKFRVDDYSEIFGSYHLSKASSIPILDLPAVEEDAAALVDVRCSELDYSEVFGGFDCVDFAVPYEELFLDAREEGGETSSEEAWTPAETGSPSEGSSEELLCSEDNQTQAYDDVKQFSMSYHKINQTSKEDCIGGTTHIAHLNAVPAFTYIVDEDIPSQKKKSDKPPSMDAIEDYWKGNSNGGVMEGEHFQKAGPEEPACDHVSRTSGYVNSNGVMDGKNIQKTMSDKPASDAVSRTSRSVNGNGEKEGKLLQETGLDKPACDIISKISRSVNPNGVTEEKQFQDTMSDDPADAAVSKISRSVNSNGIIGDQFQKTMPAEPACHSKTSERNPSGNGNYFSESFLTIAEINLKTQPCHVPPPSRPPPKIAIKQGDSRTWIASNNKAAANDVREGATSDASPPFFDVEVDASSSAAASAAAMKEAMEKAQATLKSAKVSMERKRDGLQNRKKLGLKDDLKGKQRREGAILDESIIKENKFLDHLEREASQMKGYDTEERQRATEATQVAPDFEATARASEDSQDSLDQKRMREHISTQKFPKLKEGPGKWNEEEKFYELVKKDKFEMVAEAPVQNKRERKPEHIEVYKDKLNEKTSGKGDFKQQEENDGTSYVAVVKGQLEEGGKKLKVGKEASEWEGYGKKLKEGQDLEESDKKLREDFEPKEHEKNHRDVCERQKQEKQLKEISQMEKNETRLKEAHEIEEYTKLKEAQQREEYEKNLQESRQQKEYEMKENGAREKEETEKRQKEKFEREENEKRLKEECERQKKEKWLKEVYEHEEYEKKLREVQELQENKMRQKRACEENENRLREAYEMEEKVKRQKEAFEQEKNVKLQKEACEREENEKRLRELQEQKENEMRKKEDLEMKENEKKLKEFHEREETTKKENEAHEREENKKRQQEDIERTEHEKVSVSQEGHVCKQQEQNLKTVKSFQGVAESEKTSTSSNGRSTEDEDTYCKATGGDCEVENNEKLKVVQESWGHKDNGKMMEGVEFALEAKENEELKVASQQDARLTEACVARRSPEHEVHENIKEGTSLNSLYLDDKKPVELEEAVGQENYEKCKKADRVVLDWEGKKNKLKEDQGLSKAVENEKKMEATLLTNALEEKSDKLKASNDFNATEKKEEMLSGILKREEREKEKKLQRERVQEKDRIRKFDEDRERAREREKDRMAVERATREVRERAYAEARERAERAAVERATAEVRQRALAEARERLEKASTEAREKSLAERASVEARLRAERAAVDRATAEARERAVEKAMAEKAAFEARERVDRSVSEKFSASSRDNVMRQSASFSDLRDSQFQSASSFNSSQRYANSSNHAFTTEKSQGSEVESAQRCKARLERHQRTVERAAKALAEKNKRDFLALREQAERNRLSETLDADVKRWSSGKEGNLRALLSTLQYILGPDSGWQPIPLTDVITAVAVKKAYRKATLCVHPDKLQQRGASIHQKYICEKVFDLLKEAWNKFNSEER